MTNLEFLIDNIFNRVVPGQNYRVVSPDEHETVGSIIRVNELPTDYVSPFSSTDYDYKLAAIQKYVPPLLVNIGTDYAYARFLFYVSTAGSKIADRLTGDDAETMRVYYNESSAYTQYTGLPVLNMRAFIAAYKDMGLAAYEYDY